MTCILVYLIIGWVLAVVAYFGAGQYAPDRPGLPKWVTVLLIVLLWPVLVIAIVRSKP